MLRFLLAGLITVGGLILLFLASFGDPAATLRSLQAAMTVVQSHTQSKPQPLVAQVTTPSDQTPAASPPPSVLPTRPDPSVVALQQQRDALQQQVQALQTKAAQSAEDMSALRAQVEQARRDMENFQQQQSANGAASARANDAALQEIEARQRRVADAEKALAAQQANLDQLKIAAQQEGDARRQSAAEMEKRLDEQHAMLDRLKAENERLEAVRQQRLAEAQNVPKPEETQPKDAQPSQSNTAAQPAENKATAQAASPPVPSDNVTTPPAPRNEAAREAKAANSRSTPQTAQSKPAPVKSAADAARPEPDSRESVLTRLRRQPPGNARGEDQMAANSARSAPTSAIGQPAPVTGQPEGPRATSPQDRLIGARTALMAGRLEEGRRLLEQAQVQLVFRPVEPSQEAPPSGSVAAGQVAEALSMLGAGDVPRAIQYINLAVAQANQASAAQPRAIAAVAATPAYGYAASPPGYGYVPDYYYGR